MHVIYCECHSVIISVLDLLCISMRQTTYIKMEKIQNLKIQYQQSVFPSCKMLLGNKALVCFGSIVHGTRPPRLS